MGIDSIITLLILARNRMSMSVETRQSMLINPVGRILVHPHGAPLEPMKRLWYFFAAGMILFGWTSQSMAESYSIHPVGRVARTADILALEILPEFKDALLGLDSFSHVIVFYWFNRNDSPEERATLRVHPRGDKRNPLMGVFATRSPFRPNIIGFSVCRIKAVKDCTVFVDKIDALDGSPIIDLKPYIPGNDCVPGATVPEWVRRLERE
ncbi:MAG: tRNA (N6-threonylcarbamoyladenosine(37)-N6)-methyltransferase TrmO [Desulfomonile tiedjei]|uniref:tRNA (N6-threonylcarbamoyladenosine(37)-N6)-methyltransferase TrmO n=1 Tax=Desulfomonile tiedjei TaxID=2358 RepID=A0A9D6Z100_9BACT|nr:tRNA (N6-threonylcarbamoyladenosine(37)-N6)-methyltransferase TrmO [Desulfomonile tiedjei]